MKKFTRKTEPSKEEFLEELQSTVPMPHLLATMDYGFDLVFDMLFKLLDNAISEGRINLTISEQETYDLLKQLQTENGLFSLENSTMPSSREIPDYIYGVKKDIQLKRKTYFTLTNTSG